MSLVSAVGSTRAVRALGWHRNRTLRRAVFGVLSRLGQRDARIAHHWVPGTTIRLNLFRHRGYWFHGRARERGVMENLPRLVRPGDTVIEVGGHIGYLATYLAHIVGRDGRVHVFEPSEDNLRYLRPNTADLPQVEIVPLAVSDANGIATFYVETLSGQNSSLINDYGNLAENSRNAFSDEGYHPIQVRTTTLDRFVGERGIRPDFVKIDVEGAELLALTGMADCLRRDRPRLMVEVTEREAEVMRLLGDAGYRVFDGNMRLFGPGADTGPNRFFIPEEAASAF